jgi:hypothetical protein
MEYNRLVDLARALPTLKPRPNTQKPSRKSKLGSPTSSSKTPSASSTSRASEAKLRQLESEQQQRILDGYNEEIARLADLKTIGALTYDELTQNLRNYTEQIKVAFGEDSSEYRNALASLQSAQLRISETLADQWKSDNAAFLDAWNATTGSLVAGFETAWASIFDVSLTGSQRMASVWDAMKSNFLSTIGSMASDTSNPSHQLA